ncbi:MAG: ATP-binding protein [bacterium]|nr:ATP-binding protein [bacterium]
MPSIEQTFSLQVPSSTENLAMIRDFVTRIGEQSGLGEAELPKLELAVDEACANVIEHAYGHDKTQQVTIRATCDAEEIRIEVVDSGRGFDPDKVAEHEVACLIKERRTGGLGMRLIRTLMDDVHYELEPGEKNELHMTMKLKKEPRDR